MHVHINTKPFIHVDMIEELVALLGSKVSVLLTKQSLPASATLKECRRVNTMKLLAKQLSLFPQSVGHAIGIPWFLFKNTIDTQPRLSFHRQQGAFLHSFERTERLSRQTIELSTCFFIHRSL